MKRHSVPSVQSVTRRRLLLAAPLASVAAFVPTIGLASGHSRVAVLLPNTERIPGLRVDWRQGFQSELLATNATLWPQYVEYAVGSHRALVAAQSLLEQGYTTLTGIFNRNLATQLGESLDRHSAKFLVSDLGANAIRGTATSDRLTRVGPNLWHQAYQAGQHFAQLGAKRALIATSFYEAGYDLPGAFQRGFVAAGGSTAQIVVTGTPDLASNDREFTPIADALSGNTYDVLFSMYSGREATRYLPFAQTVHANVGAMASLSTMLHGLPQSAAARASAMAIEVVTAHASSVGNAGETLYTSMGRVAARSVLASLDNACLSSAVPSRWSNGIACASAHVAAASATSKTTVRFAAHEPNSVWAPGVTSGWIAPYGA